MDKKEIRNWVQGTVQNIFEGKITEDVKNNVKIEFWYDDEDGFWESEICVKQWLYGKWELCKYFYFNSYFSNYWDLVTDPWVCDMVSDITDEVMKFIQEPKKKEW